MTPFPGRTDRALLPACSGNAAFMNRATASSVLSSEFGQPSDFGQPPDAFFNSARAARILRSPRFGRK